MAKLSGKISDALLNAIKGVFESTDAFEKSRDEEKKARMSGEDKDKVAKLAAMMSKEKKLHKEEAEQVDEKLSDEAKAAIRHAAGGGAKVKPLVKLAKMAKDKKTANEEVETLDELSTGTLKKYRSAAKADAMDADAVDDNRRYNQRAAGYKKAGKIITKRGENMLAKEEIEQVDELSRATVGRYSMKAKSIADNEGGKDRSKGRELAGRKRWGGSMSGVKPARVPATEEVQIDELSKATMGRYINKAAERMSTQGVTAGLKIAADEKSKKNFDNIKKRQKGIATATDKLTREEIEMIEAKLAGVAPGALEGDKHMCATKIFHKEWKEGTPIKTMHADPDADGLIEWYDVMFDHGIERVMTEDMEILQQESHSHPKRKMKEEAEQIDELSKDTMLKYLSANKKSDAAAQEKGDYSKSVKRMRGTDVAVRKYTAKPGSKYVRVPATEEVDLDESVAAAAKHLIKRYGDNVRKSHVRSAANDLGVGYVALSHHVRKKLGVNRLEEARGRPKKAAAKDFTVHPKTGEKLMHNNPEHMKKIEALQKTGALEKPKTEAGQHIINQLRKASTSMQGGATVHFTHGESKHVTAAHAGKALDKYAGMKPHEKEAFQKKISHSHEEMMKHI